MVLRTIIMWNKLEFFLVYQIYIEAHLLSSPEGGLCLLVHLPDVMVLNWEDDKAMGVLL